MEGPTDWLEKILLILQLPDCFDSLPRERPGEHSVVRADEKVICGLHGDGLPRAAHAGIHNCDMHSAFREVTVAGHQSERSCTNISRGNLMRDVHYRRARMDAVNDAFHGANKPVAR